MKKRGKLINIKNIMFFILGGVIFGGITVAVAGTIYASQITYTKNGQSTVEGALDYLYTQATKVEQYTCRKPTYLPTNDNTTYTQSTFVQNLKVGDLIKMTPSGTSFTTEGNKTGFTSVTINPQELQYWRVIRKNANGTVDVVSEYASSTTIAFRGVIGYAYYIGYLNEIAAHYENPNYTIGSRYMGYNGQTENIQDIGKFNGYAGGQWTSSTTANTTAADEALGAGDMGYETDYNLVKEAYKGTTTYGTNASGTTMAYKVGTTSGISYWLASRYYYYQSSSGLFFRGRYITNNSVNTYDFRGIFSGSWSDSHSNAYLRPILTLKSTVTASGIETSTGAYVLG